MPRRSIRFNLYIVAIILCLMAAPAYGAGKGQVAGQVTDSLNDMKLTGVIVSTPEGKNSAVSDDNGEYRISLPEGGHTLTFHYIGFDPISKTIQVASGETTRMDIDFGESAMMLEEVVVVGQAVGQARALNRQKTSANLKNVVASDAFGRFPDQNAAEALDRIPGVSIQRDQGEGRFVIVRGINPDLSTASVDGISLAAPDADARSVLLDVLPMNVMETLVVTKSLTPDMPGDSIGGHVDIEMPSAYDKSQRTVSGSVGGNYSELTGDWAESLQATYGEVFGADRQVGFLMSASWDARELGSDNVEAEPWEEEDGAWVTDGLEFREYDLTRERMGLTANLEFRPVEGGKYFLRGLYGEYTDHEYRRATVIGDMMMLPDGSGVAGDIVHEDFGDEEEDPYEEAVTPETSIEMKDRTETQKNLMFSIGGENVLDSWTMDYSVAYSYAEQDTPDDTEFVFVNEDLQYTYRGADTDTPSVSVVSGDIDDLSGYEFDKVEDADQIVEEKAWLLGANLKKELDTEMPAYLKGGFHVSLKNKTSDIEAYTYEGGPEGFATLEGNTSDGRNAYAGFPLIDKSLTELFENNRDAFDVEYEAIDSAVEDYETDENIYAGYLMGNLDFGKMNLLAGARVEYTDLEAMGYNVYNNEDEETLEINAETETKNYTNFLPGVHLRADITDFLIFYGAWTNTISRPNWEQTRNAQETTEEDGDVEIEVGNPELDPYEAMNWDASLSYYMPSVGMVSVGVFYKDIDNFIYSQKHDMDEYELTAWNNGASGNIYGLELAYQQQLSFLPSPMDGLSIQGNLTISESEADVPATEDLEARTIDFIGHSDTVGSFALSFEKWNFFARLSGSYQSEYLDSLGEEALEDEYIDEHFQLDLSMAYTIHEKYTVYANFINLNNEPLKAYYGESGMLRQYEEYGFSARAGVKFNF